MRQSKLFCSLLLAIASLASCTSVEPVKGVNPTRIGFALGYDDTDTESQFEGESRMKEETVTYYANFDGGYRVMPNLEVGGLFGYQSEESKFSGGGESEFELVNIGPKTRVYMVGEGNVQPWVSLAGGWSYFDAEFLGLSTSNDGYFLEAGIGISYFPSRWIAVEAAVMYQQLSLDVDEDTVAGTVRGDVDIDSTFLMIGLSTFF